MGTVKLRGWFEFVVDQFKEGVVLVFVLKRQVLALF